MWLHRAPEYPTSGEAPRLGQCRPQTAPVTASSCAGWRSAPSGVLRWARLSRRSLSTRSPRVNGRSGTGRESLSQPFLGESSAEASDWSWVTNDGEHARVGPEVGASSICALDRDADASWVLPRASTR